MLCNKLFTTLLQRKVPVTVGAIGVALHLGAASIAVAAVCPGMPDVAVYTLDTNNTLYVLPPGSDTFSKLGLVEGLADDNLVGIDFRPANGLLYGYGDKGTFYQINLPDGGDSTVPGVNGVFSFPSNPFPFGPLFAGGSQSLFDFNPVVDAVRLVGSNAQNYAITLNGSVQLVRQTNFSYPGSPPPPISITAGAYSNNFAGATTTVFYMIDYNRNALVSPPLGTNGSSNTASGQIGASYPIVAPNSPPSSTINFGPLAGLDIYTTVSSNNIGIATNGTTLYCIDIDQITRPFFTGRVVATQADVKVPDGVGAFIDVAVDLR